MEAKTLNHLFLLRHGAQAPQRFDLGVRVMRRWMASHFLRVVFELSHFEAALLLHFIKFSEQLASLGILHEISAKVFESKQYNSA